MKVTITPLQSNQPTPLRQRIQFETDETSAIVTGHLQESGSDQYVLSALGGQTMTIDLSFTEGQAILAIWGADGTVLMSDHVEASYFSRILPSTQDYYILVGEYPISSCKDFGSSIYYFLKPISAAIRGVRGYSPSGKRQAR